MTQIAAETLYVGQAANLLDRTYWQVLDLIDRGILHATRLPGGTWQIARAEVDRVRALPNFDQIVPKLPPFVPTPVEEILRRAKEAPTTPFLAELDAFRERISKGKVFDDSAEIMRQAREERVNDICGT